MSCLLDSVQVEPRIDHSTLLFLPICSLFPLRNNSVSTTKCLSTHRHNASLFLAARISIFPAAPAMIPMTDTRACFATTLRRACGVIFCKSTKAVSRGHQLVEDLKLSHSSAFHSGDPTSTDTFRAERLLSRFGHSMLYDERASTIYVFSGQRGDTYLSDMWAIRISTVSSSFHNADEDEREEEAEDVDMLGGRQSRLWRAGAVIDALQPSPVPTSDANPALTTTSPTPPRQPTILSISQLSPDYSFDGPAAAFTQRASLDSETREWTLLSGLVKDRKTGREVATDEVWCKTKEDEWEEVEVRGAKPMERFAAQVRSSR